MFVTLGHILNGAINVRVYSVEQTALLNNQTLKLLVNGAQRVYGLHYFGYLLIALLGNILLHHFKLLLRQP